MLRFVLFCFFLVCSVLPASGSSDSSSAVSAAATIEIDVESATPSDETPAEPEVMPELTSFVKAAYPSDLVRNGITGTVLLELLVNDSGTVDSASVIDGVNSRLDSSAVTAARQFVFSPAQADGAPVAVYLQYAYTFSLEDAVDSIPLYCNFSGRLLEKGTRKPLADALIAVSFPDSITDTTLSVPFPFYLKKITESGSQHLEDNALVTHSTQDGSFAFFSLPQGSLSLKIFIPGYEVYTSQETIDYSNETVVAYYIERDDYSEYELIVYGKSEKKEVSKRKLSVNDIKKVPGFGGDAIKAIQALPGVSRQSAGSGEVIVRGSPTWDSRFFLEGMEIPLLYHFGDLKSTYNSDALTAIDFYPGGFSSRYGGAIAGIVEVTARKGTSERIKGAAEISTLDGSVMIEGPVTNNITFIANARRSFIGDLVSELFKLAPEYFPFTFYPYYWDYTFRTDLSTERLGQFYLSVFGSKDSLTFIYPGMRFGTEELSEQTDRMGMNTEFHTAVLGWDYPVNDAIHNSFKYNIMKINDRFISSFGTNKKNILVNHIRNQLSWKLNSSLLLQTGADMQWSSADLDIRFPVATNRIETFDIPDWHFSDLAGYCILEYKPTERLQIMPSIRFDYYDELDYNGSVVPEFWDYNFFINDRGISGEPSARISSRYTLKKHHTLKAAIGTYNQTPEPMGEVLMPKWGDPHMPATNAVHYVAGYEWQITDLLDLDVQTYLNRQWNIPVISSSEGNLTPGMSIYNHSGLGKMYGLELMLRHQQGKHFFGWATYSLSRSERYNRSTKKWKVFGQDETHYLQLVGSWKLFYHSEAGFHIKFASGKPAVIYNGIDYIQENNQGASRIVPQKRTTGLDRMGPALQIDLRVERKFIYKKTVMTTFFDLQNIGWFLYKSPDWYQYSDFYDEKKPFSMFPLVAIGVRYEF